ncbi:DUF2254 domain-containing protein [Paludisphaera soli]|uniref:DUF2254 domain-containing protein n=1 Tax=Paludisphaera soli TaxID=2712865 RepID=UPI0013ECD6AB|nr:DUF2254 domain-containing protein [Paludisphaera soli]
MKIWLVGRWDDVRTSFWFVPTLMVAGAVLLSLATIHLDKATPSRNGLATLGWTFTRGPEGSRAVLSTVAGSMMTIASVTFSITVVALQLASSQFGPRLLRNFMRDRGNQVAIGTFIATFTYCLLVLRTVNGTEDERFVPHISVTVGLLLALASLGVLIYFIHHAAESIQAENVIAAVGRELDRDIDRLYPKGLGRGPGGDSVTPDDPNLPDGFEADSRAIAVEDGGHLRAIDADRLMALASERDLVLAVERRPGKFLFPGDALARAWPGDRVDDELAGAIRGAFFIGPRRTQGQDVEFVVDQLVEIALRALDPGNDPFTAIGCLDRLGAALCKLAGRTFPSRFRHDEAGRLRVVTDASTPSGIVDAAFNQIRQASRSDAAVTLRLLEVLAEVGRRARDPGFREALRRHADAVDRGATEALADPLDREEAKLRHRNAIAILGAGPGSGPATAGTPT